MSEIPHVIHHGYVTVRVGTDVGRPGKESTCFKKVHTDMLVYVSFLQSTLVFTVIFSQFFC